MYGQGESGGRNDSDRNGSVNNGRTFEQNRWILDRWASIRLSSLVVAERRKFIDRARPLVSSRDKVE